MSHFRVDRGGWGDGIRDMCVSTMILPLGVCTQFPPYMTGTFSFHVQVVGMKWLVQPKSATASSKGGVTRV